MTRNAESKYLAVDGSAIIASQAVPGVQCLVDPFAIQVWIGDKICTLHCVAFVLACSRLKYVGLSLHPLDQESFIHLHDKAFRYFGGVTFECLYDHAVLTTIDEQCRKLHVSQVFKQYATTAGYRIRTFGFDSKSRCYLEREVNFISRALQKVFDVARFADDGAVHAYISDWLEVDANARLHDTTLRVPREHFVTEEQSQLRPYLVPDSLLYKNLAKDTQQVNKTDPRA
ncbi:hypothetical protein GNX18_16915 [Microbulbifer sp. SH-1]|uniref:transposase n=1 Tax=Microbulbifer sp. SH-1 TaxID=2681547 RepID=UPI00140B53FF|nr:transposase [Microbulbifer sp. SH-1]QIL91280.1 hypothetical protein GNX18_16915 [Microbulbifer sp. SH-1]